MRGQRYFERGGRGVFKCVICERSTRRTTQGGDSELCGECWEIAGLENQVFDSEDQAIERAKVRPECDSLAGIAVKRGGNLERIHENFRSIWPKEPA